MLELYHDLPHPAYDTVSSEYAMRRAWSRGCLVGCE
jgi:hypothetical protein